MGDPTEDLSLFMSPAMQSLYRGAPLDTPERDEFLAAYPDRRVISRLLDLQPWYHWRMAAYCLWQGERGRPDYADAAELELEALSAASVAM